MDHNCPCLCGREVPDVRREGIFADPAVSAVLDHYEVVVAEHTEVLEAQEDRVRSTLEMEARLRERLTEALAHVDVLRAALEKLGSGFDGQTQELETAIDVMEGHSDGQVLMAEYRRRAYGSDGRACIARPISRAHMEGFLTGVILASNLCVEISVHHAEAGDTGGVAAADECVRAVRAWFEPTEAQVESMVGENLPIPDAATELGRTEGRNPNA